MRCGVGPLLAVIVWSLAPFAAGQEAPNDEEEAEPVETPVGPVVVVVESARRGVGPAAIRSALGERLGGAEVRGFTNADGPTRAWVAVAVHRDGSTDVRVVSQNGNESATHLDATGSDLAPAMAIAHRIGELLGAAEADPPIGSVARHGLIPWEEEGLRPYPNREARFRRIEGESLLPWPRAEEGGSSRSRAPSGPERAAGLAAPSPRPGAQPQNR